ncbi:MAG: GNAT family N-acetyltransferase [Devosia sp.]|nr:GNAT family N-acetyltransferase [Devosia sp.]
MGEEWLDNPVWHALRGPHAHLALRFGSALRYRPEVAPFTALEAMQADRLREIAPAIPEGGAAAILTLDVAEAPPGLSIRSTGVVLQMTARTFRPLGHETEFEVLGAADVPEMLALVELTHPGPFGPRTIEMGRYIGLRRDGRLIAMAGERMRLPGFTEVSAVCVHPEHRGHGYAKMLVSAVVAPIVARRETPFLHSYPDNRPAVAAYEALGFTGRRMLNFTLLQRAA